jgi:hypothetical protein
MFFTFSFLSVFHGFVQQRFCTGEHIRSSHMGLYNAGSGFLRECGAIVSGPAAREALLFLAGFPLALASGFP